MRKTLATFDLFPFLGILICLLACLLLIVMTMVAFSVGPCITEIWVVEGTSEKLPTMVEWNGEDVIIYPEKISVPANAAFENLDEENGENDSAFGRLLAEVKAAGDSRYIYFAVRPSGFYNFTDFFWMVKNYGVDVGYEPVEQNRPLGIREGD